MSDSEDKVLVDNRSILKEGDKVEIVVKGIIHKIDDGIILKAYLGHSRNFSHIYFNDVLKSIHKILPKATPLEVGELLIDDDPEYSFKVLHINKRCFKQVVLIN